MCDTSLLKGWYTQHKQLLAICHSKEHSGFKKVNGMRNIDKVLKHLNVNGNITHRDAISDYNMTGGSLTKYISLLREHGYLIHTQTKKHKTTGVMYTSYELVRGLAHAA